MGVGGLLGGFLFDVSGGYHLAFVVGVAFNIANLLLIGLFVWLMGRDDSTPQFAVGAKA